MTRSKALQFLLASAMAQIVISALLLGLNNPAGWAFFVLGVICVASFLAAIGIDVITSLRAKSDNADTEFDL